MELKRLDIVTEIEFEALRLLLVADPDPEFDATMRQIRALAILVKLGLKDREHLRHDVLRVITGVPVTTQYGLSYHVHSQLIHYLKEEDDEEPAKWKLSLRGRRLLDECAGVAEALANEYEDGMELWQAQARVWDMWVPSSALSSGSP